MLNGLVPPLIVALSAALLLWCRRIYLRRGGRQWRADLAAAIGIVCVTALLEIAMGRSLTYRNGPIRPWVSEVDSDENSQQVSDWYTFSHVIHGALFYGVTHLTMGPYSLGTFGPTLRKAHLLRTVYSMRQELSALWSRSSATRTADQLLEQLHDWRTRAESSGVAALREFSRRLPHLVRADSVGAPARHAAGGGGIKIAELAHTAAGDQLVRHHDDGSDQQHVQQAPGGERRGKANDPKKQ